MTAWRAAAIAAAAGGAAGFAGGWAAHRAPAPGAIDREQDLHLRELQLHQLVMNREEGPVRTVERWRSSPASSPNCPAIEEHERVTELGPVTVHQEAVNAVAREVVTRDVLHVVEAPRARWAVFGGLQLVPEQLPQLGLGLRVAGGFWVEAWARPRLALELPAAGVQARLEF